MGMPCPHPLIADAEDPLAVGHDDDAHRLGIHVAGREPMSSTFFGVM